MNFKTLVKRSVAQFGYSVRKMAQPGNGVHGIDCWEDSQWLLRDRRVRTLLDVGANVGQTALALAGIFPEADIYSFEPFPESFALLKGAVAHLPRVKPIPAALGEDRATKEFFVNAHSQTNSLLRNSQEASTWLGEDMLPAKEAITVPVCPLDDFLTERQIKHVDILKLDAQGYELRILNGARETLRRKAFALVLSEVLFVQHYEGQAWFHEIYARLSEHGYSLVGLYGNTYSEDGRLLWADALFAAPPDAIKSAP